jgi:nicotinamidase-related amidase
MRVLRLEIPCIITSGGLNIPCFKRGVGENFILNSNEEEDLIAQNHWIASGFVNIDLDFLLKQHNRDHVVIAGMSANTCIHTIARYAVELDYHATPIKDILLHVTGTK